jgi:hypothetical protein
MAVDSSVPAKEQDHIGTIGSRRHPDAPVDARINLERLQVFRRTSQSKDGSRTHLR